MSASGALSQLARAVSAGDRRALAKAITLVESTLQADHAASLELLSLVAVPTKPAFRIGVTGVPGAGKSTLIDALGLQALAAGQRVAVLAIDPSSQQSGGSVLGDKTRMTRLSTEPSAFVRPSPTLGVLGGTGSRTRELIALCEAAGYDLVLVETVGVGQSEERVASMVDCVLLLILAGAGDELSSMKRGLLESADLIAFNKADGDRVSVVENEAAALRASLGISRGQQVPPVVVISGHHGTGVATLWQSLSQYQQAAKQSGTFVVRRAAQRRAWFDAALDTALRDLFVCRPEMISARIAAEKSVESGSASPWEAAERLVAGLALAPGA
ncbi:MAG: methylmalonyl Co-A mutase-associated GTPase MeaB [Polyangiaceae bacterium]